MVGREVKINTVAVVVAYMGAAGMAGPGTSVTPGVENTAFACNLGRGCCSG